MTDPTPGGRSTFRAGVPLLLGAFFLSGICGLVHEVAWTRMLRHVMGNTTFSITTVLTVFMAGLALGSFLAGRWIEGRRDPVRVFALLEAAIGITCLAIPFAINGLEPVYRVLYQSTSGSFALLSLVRFLFCGLVLLPTATMMGATLPILVRFFVGASGAVGLSVGKLYAINTLGAVVGAAGAGFVLVPMLGLTHTIWTASALNLIVCGLGLWLHARLGEVPTAEGRDRPADSEAEVAAGVKRLVLGAYALSGFSALAYEVVWTRVLSAMIGPSVYAFSMMLTAFILGLGLGSLVFARFVDRVRHPLRTLAYLQIGIATSALLVVPLFAVLPLWVTGLISRQAGSFWGLHGAEFGLLVAIMLVPTTLMGATFPLVNRIHTGQSGKAARSVGATYSANTIGSIVGSLAAGFLLIPTLGTQWTIYVAVLVNGLAATLFAVLGTSWTGLGRRVALATPAWLLVAVLLLPAWSPKTMYFGSFFMARAQSTQIAQSSEAMRAMVSRDEILLHEEGIDTTVTVRRNPLGHIALLVNGKPDASSHDDMPTQILLAHVPLLLHPDPKDVLVIGLASGVTLGSAASHPVERLDCAEISSAVVHACEFFAEYNNDVLNDPRVDILVADGRNHLALSGRRYDVIISEPSNPWITGVADLFTHEFFTKCRDALTDRGVVCIWIERYNIDKRSFQSVVRTFHDVFPTMTLWNPRHADYLLVGGKSEVSVGIVPLARRLANEAVAKDLERIGVTDIPSFLSHLVTGADGAARLAGDAPLHTDDNALLEFAAPRVMVVHERFTDLFEAIQVEREVNLDFLRSRDPTVLAQVRADAKAAIETRALAVRAEHERELGRNVRAMQLLKEAALGNLSDRVVQDEVTRGLELARQLVALGRSEAGVSTYRAFLEIDPSRATAHCELGLSLLNAGDCNGAQDHFQAAVAAEPDSLPAMEGLALLLATHPDARRRNPRLAFAYASRVAESLGESPVALRTLAAAQAANGQLQAAVASLSTAIQVVRRDGPADFVPILESMQNTYRGGRLWFLQCR